MNAIAHLSVVLEQAIHDQMQQAGIRMGSVGSRELLSDPQTFGQSTQSKTSTTAVLQAAGDEATSNL